MAENKSGDGSMVTESMSLQQRAEAFRWLISFQARQPINGARERVESLRRRRRGHSGRGIAADDRAALCTKNPKLEALRQRYAGVRDDVRSSRVWRAGSVAADDLLYFRGDNAYVFQFRDKNTPEKYVLTYFYLKTIDTLGLLDVFTEDGDYGVFTFPTGDTDKDGKKRFVSRDLLDSVSELLFLERALEISRRPGLKVLDIGAGYGRLAYRTVTALSNIDTYFCTDAIPESTFLSEYYLAKKGAARTHVVPFDDQQDLIPGTIDLAVNIHSFSEISVEAVDYWVSRCAELKVEYLFIIPNISAESEKAVRMIDGTNFSPLLAQHGYHLCHAEPKYGNPEVQKYGVSPKWYYLFQAT